MRATMCGIAILSLLCSTFVTAEELDIAGGVNEHGLMGSHFSYLDDLRYEFGMTHKQANELSVWKRGDKNPPLAPRDAVEAATRMLTELKLLDAKWMWELHAVQLHPIAITPERADGIELWQYVVTFQRWPNPKPMAWGGAVPEMRLVVLMNGEALRPLISKERH